MAEYAIGGLTPEQRHDLEDALGRRSIEAHWSDTTLAVPDAAAYVVTGLVDQARRGALAGMPLPPPPNPYLDGPGAPGGPPGPTGPTGPGGGSWLPPAGGYAGAPPPGYPAYPAYPGAPPGAGPGYGYGRPGYPGYGGPPPRKSNGLAVAALIMGVLSFATCPLVGIGALICGYKGRTVAREQTGEGGGMALAGIILGWCGVALSVAFIFFYGGIIAFAVASPSISSPRVYTPPRSVTTSTIPYGTTTLPRPNGSTAAPSGVISLDDCKRVALAYKNLTDVSNPDRGILLDAASTLQASLPASSADDIDALLNDGLSRIGHSDTGPPPQSVLDASDRINAVIHDACPN